MREAFLSHRAERHTPAIKIQSWRSQVDKSCLRAIRSWGGFCLSAAHFPPVTGGPAVPFQPFPFLSGGKGAGQCHPRCSHAWLQPDRPLVGMLRDGGGAKPPGPSYLPHGVGRAPKLLQVAPSPSNFLKTPSFELLWGNVRARPR